MKKLVCVFILLAPFIFTANKAGAYTTDCAECFRECDQLFSLYKESFRQEGKGGDSRADDKIRAARDKLFRCLRYYGHDGTDADKLIDQLKEEAKSQP